MTQVCWPDRGRKGLYRFFPGFVCVIIFCTGYILGGSLWRDDAIAQNAAEVEDDADEIALPPTVDLQVTDNSTCMVCHMDFQFEDLSQTHEVAGVPCARCHGFSAAHQMDEMSATTPDFLFGRKEIPGLCSACHEDGHANPDAVDAFREQWRGKQRPNGRSVAADSVCTDCHGNHAIAKQGGM